MAGPRKYKEDRGDLIDLVGTGGKGAGAASSVGAAKRAGVGASTGGKTGNQDFIANVYGGWVGGGQPGMTNTTPVAQYTPSSGVQAIGAATQNALASGVASPYTSPDGKNVAGTQVFPGATPFTPPPPQPPPEPTPVPELTPVPEPTPTPEDPPPPPGPGPEGGSGGGGGAGAGDTGAPDFAGQNKQILDEMEKYYQDLLASDEKSWGDTQGLLQGQIGQFGREADVLNARLGRSIGGGYASLAGAAMGKGTQTLAAAALQHDEKRRGMQLDFLDKKIGEKLRQQGQNEDRYRWEEGRKDTKEGREASLEAGLRSDWLDFNENLPPGEKPIDFATFKEAMKNNQPLDTEGPEDTTTTVDPNADNGVTSAAQGVDGEGGMTFKLADGSSLKMGPDQVEAFSDAIGRNMNGYDAGGAATAAMNYAISKGWTTPEQIDRTRREEIAAYLKSKGYNTYMDSKETGHQRLTQLGNGVWPF